MTNSSASTLPSALDSDFIEKFFSTTVSHKTTIFLDYDGTLTPIVSRPEVAILGESTRKALARLSSHCLVTIVTGRDISVVKKFVQLDQLAYAGCHGLDIEGPVGSGLRYEVALEWLPLLEEAEINLRSQLSGIKGVIVERKRYSLSTHYRLVEPHEVSRVEQVVLDVLMRYPKLRREGGKMLYELRPDIAWHKGSAVAWMLEATSNSASRAIYIGDDETDENALKWLSGTGIGIVVGPENRQTEAHYRVNDPAQVLQLLERILSYFVESRSSD
tara:strand:- start:4136 stop:4957 length:822 start_codon:yes stop_codon:yes gene_type:complete